MQQKSELLLVQERLKMKECLAQQAKKKGMECTYTNYVEDIKDLRKEIKKLEVIVK